MKIAIYNTESFIGKNFIENLINIRDGKNRTRPNLSISEIYQNERNDADTIIILPGGTYSDIVENHQGARVICCSSMNEGINGLPNNTLVYKFPDIIGKWQRPEDGAIANLCHAVANDEWFEVQNKNEIIEFLFIDDFFEEMLDALEGRPHRCDFPEVGEVSSDPTAQYDGKTPVPNEKGKYCYSPKVMRTTMGSVVDQLDSFNRLKTTLIVPEIPVESLAYKLFSMYLSYLPERKMSYPVKMTVDNRGVFAELVKTANNGQVSINIARPGNVRGQHWHNTKWEIFIVVSGHGLIQEREIGTDKVFNFEVRGEEMRAVIMLPGYTHNIINLEKDKDLVTVMFANEQFDPNHPDTYFEVVDDSLEL